jgi:hypothetical protein
MSCSPRQRSGAAYGLARIASRPSVTGGGRDANRCPGSQTSRGWRTEGSASTLNGLLQDPGVQIPAANCRELELLAHDQPDLRANRA